MRLSPSIVVVWAQNARAQRDSAEFVLPDQMFATTRVSIGYIHGGLGRLKHLQYGHQKDAGVH